MRVQELKPALVSVVSALAASLCCLLPLAVIILGLGSGAFMATTMRYQRILLPLGILGVTAGYVLYVRERRRCRTLVCTMAGGRFNLVALSVATVVLVALPEATSELLSRAMVSAADRQEYFEAKGTIVAVDPERPAVTIDHGEIKRLMSPMTMAFPVESIELLKGIAAGDRVTFQLLRTPKTLAVVGLTKEAPSVEEQVALDIEGMTWGSWPLAVKKALEGLTGVRRADVSFSTKQAVVSYEADKVGVAEMITAIKKAGFSASLHQ